MFEKEELTPEHIEIHRQEELEELGDLDLESFGEKSVAAYEIFDRSKVITEMWKNLVMSHPACIMNKELYEQAS